MPSKKTASSNARKLKPATAEQTPALPPTSRVTPPSSDADWMFTGWHKPKDRDDPRARQVRFRTPDDSIKPARGSGPADQARPATAPPSQNRMRWS